MTASRSAGSAPADFRIAFGIMCRSIRAMDEARDAMLAAEWRRDKKGRKAARKRYRVFLDDFNTAKRDAEEVSP